MIKTFNGMDQLTVYAQALKFTTFDAIKDAFLAAMDADPNYADPAVRNAIRLAAERIKVYQQSEVQVFDGPLMGILFVPWESVGAAGVPALTSEQRESIFGAIMQICKGAIAQEAQRLQAVAALDTTLPVDWNAPDPPPEEPPVEPTTK